MKRVYSWFGGVSEFYAFIFVGCGIALAFRNELSSSYVCLVGAIQALIVVNDQGDSYNASKAVQTIQEVSTEVRKVL